MESENKYFCIKLILETTKKKYIYIKKIIKKFN